MRRFFVTPQQVKRDEAGRATTIVLDADEATHLVRVLRLSVGDKILVCDGTGKEYDAELTLAQQNAAEARVLSEQLSRNEPQVQLQLFQGLPKSDKMDLVVQKSTELGVSAVFPVVTERTVVKLSGEKAHRRVTRWEKVAQEAAKQSGRALVPQVGDVGPLHKVVADHLPKYLLVPWEEATLPLATVLSTWQPLLSSAQTEERKVGVVIGPEGGLSPSEVADLQSLGAVPVTLGPRILRTETAGMATIAAVMYALGEFGGAKEQ